MALCIESNVDFTTQNYAQNGNPDNTEIKGGNVFLLDRADSMVNGAYTSNTFHVYLNLHRVLITAGDYHF